MAVKEIIMVRILIKTMKGALRCVVRANRAKTDDKRNLQLNNLGSKLIIMGAISLAATIIALVCPPERVFAYPAYMHMILVAILGFIAVFALSGITVGMFLLVMKNPGAYPRLAAVAVWVSCVAAGLAIGVLLAASFT